MLLETEIDGSCWKLVIIEGQEIGRVYPLHDGNNLLGRWDADCGSFPEVDLETEDPDSKISRKHAIIECKGDKICIEDLGSLNGTYMNGDNQLDPGAEYELKAGDRISLGKTSLRLESNQ